MKIDEMIGFLRRILFLFSPPYVPKPEPQIEYVLVGGPADGRCGLVHEAVRGIIIPRVSAVAVYELDRMNSNNRPSIEQIHYERTNKILGSKVVFTLSLDCKFHPGLYPKGMCIGTECEYPDCLIPGASPPLRDRLTRLSDDQKGTIH